MYPITFSQRLVYARKEVGYTQEQVANMLKINRNTLASYETGRVEPPINTIAMLADFYYVSADWLLGTRGGKKE